MSESEFDYWSRVLGRLHERFALLADSRGFKDICQGFRNTSTMMKALCIMVLCGYVLAALFGQSSSPQGEQSIGAGSPETGQQLYVAYCASCHGTDGKGHGEISRWLKVSPADLTTLADRNHGTFPYQGVFSVIGGDSTTATHGSKDMPVWGPIFLIRNSRNPGEARDRINSVVQYIRSMQCSACD